MNDLFFDEETRQELAALDDPEEIEDRFYRDLEFGPVGNERHPGTGPLSADMCRAECCPSRGTAIGYDTRKSNKFYSEVFANVRPTSHLSLSLRYWNKVSICVEPFRRDTFPAILLAATYPHDEPGVSE